LTDDKPYQAMLVVLRRVAFVLVPLSVLFVKYYPAYGRTYNRWTYQPMYTGAALHKNGLGQICLVAGIVFGWTMLKRRDQVGSARTRAIFLDLAYLAMIGYLMIKANSATSLACFAMSIGVLVASRLPAFARDPRRIVQLGFAATCILGLLELTFDFSDSVVRLLGRDPTLTTRLTLWQELLAMGTNPIIGVGYESFWLGDRLEAIWQNYEGIKQAHNGYLEVYLNLGLVGVVLMVGALVSGLLRVARQIETETHNAVLRLCFIMVVALYNVTEATFYGASNMWTLLLLGIVQGSRWDVAGHHAGQPTAGRMSETERLPKRFANRGGETAP
jgi:O-antigen ligase